MQTDIENVIYCYSIRWRNKKNPYHFSLWESIFRRKYYFSNVKLSSCIKFNIFAILFRYIIQLTKESKSSVDNFQNFQKGITQHVFFSRLNNRQVLTKQFLGRRSNFLTCNQVVEITVVCAGIQVGIPGFRGRISLS